MKYQFSVAEGEPPRVIPQAYYQRWMKQSSMPYAELSEVEKDSDRKEADRVLAIVAEHALAADCWRRKAVTAAISVPPPVVPQRSGLCGTSALAVMDSEGQPQQNDCPYHVRLHPDEKCTCPPKTTPDLDAWHLTPEGDKRWKRCRRCGHEYYPFHQEGIFPTDAASLAFKSGWNIGDYIHTIAGCAAAIDNGTSSPAVCSCGGWMPGSFVTDAAINTRDLRIAELERHVTSLQATNTAEVEARRKAERLSEHRRDTIAELRRVWRL